MKRFTLIIISVVIFQCVFAESTLKNLVFAKRDTCTLTMDVYTPIDVRPNTPCIIFVFGGGFKGGSKSTEYNLPYLKAMANCGYVVAAIDYRLGLKNTIIKRRTALKLLGNAINMAVEDLYSATNYLLQHVDELNIDPTKIIISGSSAGAITVLQADYELSNRTTISSVLPTDFHYAGVISFAGGILNFHGKPSYKEAPAPTMLFHGTEDKLVKYTKTQIFRTGFFGTDAIVKQFEKFDYPYYAYRYFGNGHEIAGVPMNKNIVEICSFINDYVIEHKKLKKDMIIKDPDVKPTVYGKWKFNDLYK